VELPIQSEAPPDAERSAGAGSRVDAVLPNPPAAPAAAGDAAMLAAPPTPQGSRPGPDRALRILLVEDHPATLTALGRLVASMGHEPARAGSVEEARRAARDEAYDLVIADLGLPDGSGHDLMRWLRERGVKGIALSGFGSDDDLRRSREAGFEEHLVKPVTMETLRDAIRRVAGRQG
jgi:CheY-like chemotaxis protein